MDKVLNLFYEEPDPDRWFKYDRYPRKFLRRILRGKPRPGGVMMIALELMKGLDRLGIPYRFNDYKYAKTHPEELIGVIGKPHLIFGKKFINPILFGAGVFSHPIECIDFFLKYPNVKKMLVPGEWMRKMCDSFYPNKIESWAVGIDTIKWSPHIKKNKLVADFLIYDKIRWERLFYQTELINPIKKELEKLGLSYNIIRYGEYNHQDFIDELSEAKAVIFLCEHETQGIAYQEILATNTSIFAWDRGGFWQDPYYYPHKVKYEPVTSVPYWDNRCGMKFKDLNDFNSALPQFIKNLNNNIFEPRKYILENLTLEISAQKYLNIMNSINEDIANS
ncbi:hypothetical protein [Pedobacter agri]|uniref:hypothetical protein n=1 Tax=Pedobacter agri TaxID=454586 RepID=UPI00292EAE86|nr:hypothetical protein [Pedobacter agri]